MRLTSKEFELFRVHARSGRAACSPASACWSACGATTTDVDARSIDAHIRRLRVKLGPARDHVETVVGIGYRFVVQPRTSLAR